jgi:REP element-mobilizing transposase RayT
MRRNNDRLHSNLPHFHSRGYSYFVTFRKSPETNDFSDREREIISDCIKFFHRSKYLLVAYVVMDDHAHAVLTLLGDSVLNKIIHSWKSFSANQIQHQMNKRGSIWQPNYWDKTIYGIDDMCQYTKYILSNPWKRWPMLKTYRHLGVSKDYFCSINTLHGTISPIIEFL